MVGKKENLCRRSVLQDLSEEISPWIKFNVGWPYKLHQNPTVWACRMHLRELSSRVLRKLRPQTLKISDLLGVSKTKTFRKPQTPEKLRSLGVLKTQTLQYFSNIVTNYRLRATSLSLSHLQKRNFVLQKYFLSKSSHWEHFDKNQILLTVCNETLCWDRYVWRSFQIKRSDMLVIVKPVLLKKLPKKKKKIKINHLII